MELRTLRYFLAVTQEGTITKAAETVHVSQPALSRQIAELERELGVALFDRTNKRIALTDAGRHFAERAREVVDLAARAKAEAQQADETLAGEVRVGGAEAEAMRCVARAGIALQCKHPQVSYRIYGGNAPDVFERLDAGLLDFGVLADPVDLTAYEHIELPASERWGLFVPRTSKFVRLSVITPTDLQDARLITPERAALKAFLSGWLGYDFSKLNVAATYNLGTNARFWAAEGNLCVLGQEKTLWGGSTDPFTFRPFYPALPVRLFLAWKRRYTIRPLEQAFLHEVRAQIALTEQPGNTLQQP